MEENKISKEQIKKGIILMGAFILLRAGMVQLFGNPSGHIDLNYVIFLSVLFFIGSVGLVYFGFTKWVGIDLKKWWFNRKSIKGDIGWGILGLIIVMILSSVLAVSLLSFGLISKETIPAQPDLSLSLVLSGLFFGWLKMKRGNLLAPFIAHGFMG
jgi:membrane protease YdiL (CAAX protease family)